MIFRAITFIIALSFFALLLQGCSGSRKGEEGTTTEGESQQKKELDEIEALLGVSPEQKKDDQTSGQKDDETLGLLNNRDVLNQSPAEDGAKTKKLQKQVRDLKSQVTEKDLIISDLKAQLSYQNEQMKSQRTQPAASGGFSLSGADANVDAGEYEMRYQDGFQQFQNGDYKGAIQSFESLLASDANHSLADNAQYWIGESHYALRQYSKAIIDFEKVFTFPKSNKKDDAQFKLGLCYLRKGDAQKAREEFQRLIDVYPKSEYINRAQKHLNSL